MENFLKVTAILLTLGVVIFIYPALIWAWFIKPFFWVIYIILLAVDLWCIKTLKKMQIEK